MKTYSAKITLSMNRRGVLSLDPIMGCTSGTAKDLRGCYLDCYAAQIASRYGLDFARSIKRTFESQKHIDVIRKKINKRPEKFLRMGTSGDPSEAWSHTVDICEMIQPINKPIVIITKHWMPLLDDYLERLKKCNVIVNTSVSAMDSPNELIERLSWHDTLNARGLKSILRVVTCDFNTDNFKGEHMDKVQSALLNRGNAIETVFRPSAKNPLVIAGIIRVSKIKFLSGKVLASKRTRKVYFGKCSTCREQCGAPPESGLTF